MDMKEKLSKIVSLPSLNDFEVLYHYKGLLRISVPETTLNLEFGRWEIRITCDNNTPYLRKLKGPYCHEPLFSLNFFSEQTKFVLCEKRFLVEARCLDDKPKKASISLCLEEER